MQNARRKETPLSMRLPVRDIDLITRAAQARGSSRTEFIREAAVRAAETVLLDRALVQMSPVGFSAFTRAIAGKGKAVAALVKVLERKAPWE